MSLAALGISDFRSLQPDTLLGPQKTTENTAEKSGFRHDWTPDEVLAQADALEKSVVAAFDALAAVSPAEITSEGPWKAVGSALADAEHFFAVRSSNLGFLMHVSPAKEVREAATGASTRLEKLELNLMTRRDVYDVVKLALKTGEESGSLAPLQQRFLKKVAEEFERNGVHLEGAEKERLVKLREELSELETQFSKNLGDVDDSLAFTKEELAGCDDEFLVGLEPAEGAGNDGKFKIDTSYPHVFAVLDFCTVEETRKQVSNLFASRAQNNSPLMDRAVEIREEVAPLLGFKSHVDFRSANRMAKSAANIDKFISDIRGKMKPATERDIAALLQLKRETTGDDSAELGQWDVRFYARMRKEKEYSIDMQEIKSYFPLDKVTDGLLAVYQEILNLKFTEVESPHVWHEDVRLFSVHDVAEGEPLVGHFYLDLYPREGKYGHAAVWGLVPRHVEQQGEGRVQKPVCAMVCNFPKPSEATPRPTVSHSDVVTYFHEFGHVMHGLLTESDISRFSGTHVERDFVEAPSQMLENWGYEREVLNRLSEKPLPEALCDALKNSRLANIGYLTSRQLFFATFDFQLHTRSAGGKIGATEVGDLWKSLSQEIVNVPVAKEIGNPAASFGHLMGGYDAGYYGYMWSEVYSHDMYSVFADSGKIVNAELGQRYRKHILAPGGTADSAEGLAAFLGREPSTDAFFKHLGVEIDAKL